MRLLKQYPLVSGLLTLFVFFSLSGCSSSKNSSEDKPTIDFALTDVTLTAVDETIDPLSTDFTNQDQVVINFTVDVDTDSSDYLNEVVLLVNFQLMENGFMNSASGDIDDETEEESNVFLGTRIFSKLTTGMNELSATLELPEDYNGSEGTYRIIPVLDPENQYAELHEDNNYPSRDNFNTGLTASLDFQPMPPRFVIEEAVIPHIFLPAEGVPADESLDRVTGHAKLGFHYPGVFTDELTARLNVEVFNPGSGVYESVLLWHSNTTVSFDGKFRPETDVNIAGEYRLEAIPIRFSKVNMAKHVPFNLRLQKEQVDALIEQFEPDAQSGPINLRVTVIPNPETTVGDLTFSPVVEVLETTIGFPPSRGGDVTPSLAASSLLKMARASFSSTSSGTSCSGSDYSKGDGMSKSVGDDDYVAISISAGAYLDMCTSPAFAEGSVSADFEVTVFDEDFTLASAELYSYANIDEGGETGYDVVFIETTYWDDSVGFSNAWTKDQSWSISYKPVDYSFYLLFEIDVEAGVTGSVGIDAEIGTRNNSSGYPEAYFSAAVPYLSVDAFASASAGIDVWVASASASVSADFDIVYVGNTFEGSGYINSDSDSLVWDIDNDIVITGFSGDISVEAEYSYSYFKWCCKVKTKTKDKSYTLYEVTNPYLDESYPLYDKNGSISF